MYWNILTKEKQELLDKVASAVFANDFYLAGGTALSLQLGLRESYDFDFFTRERFSTEVLLERVQGVAKDVKILNMTDGTLDLVLNGTQTSFFYHPHVLLDDYVHPKEMPQLNLASVRDIACMKLLAIGNRGTKKDFFDLYQVLKNGEIAVSGLARDFQVKYGAGRSIFYIAKGLAYFDDAEAQNLPSTHVDYSWDEIKRYFTRISDVFLESYHLEADTQKNTRKPDKDDDWLEL